MKHAGKPTNRGQGASRAQGDAELSRVDGLLKALADPTRLRIVGLLGAGEICVCHVHSSLRISQPKASRHLAYLRRAGVVQAEKRGLWVYYRLAVQPSPAAQRLLDSARDCFTGLETAKRDCCRLEKARPDLPIASTAPLDPRSPDGRAEPPRPVG